VLPGPPADLPLLTADLGSGVRAWFTTRAGGTSVAPWESLNLALHVHDDLEHVAANRGLLAGRVGAPVRFARQVHGTRTLTLEGAGDDDPLRGDLGQDDGGYDGLVAAVPGIPVGVLVADCVPVLLADRGAGVVATAHAGRAGLLGGVLEAVVAAMAARGARRGRIRAVLGPSAGACCYEVPRTMQDAACAVVPAVRATTRSGTPALDLRAGCRALLATAGVEAVTELGGCTIDDESLFSYRRAPVTGRFAGVVMMQA
jgi:YfiH family protein